MHVCGEEVVFMRRSKVNEATSCLLREGRAVSPLAEFGPKGKRKQSSIYRSTGSFCSW